VLDAALEGPPGARRRPTPMRAPRRERAAAKGR